MLIYTQKINRAGMPSRPPHPPAPPPPPWGAGSLPDRRVAVLEGGVDLGKHLGADPRRGPEADARKERKRVAGRSPFVQTFLMVLFLAVLKPPSPKRAQTFMFRGVCGSVGPESSGRGFARLSALSDFRLCVNCAIHGIGLDPRLSIPPGANCPEGGGGEVGTTSTATPIAVGPEPPGTAWRESSSWAHIAARASRQPRCPASDGAASIAAETFATPSASPAAFASTSSPPAAAPVEWSSGRGWGVHMRNKTKTKNNKKIKK